MGEQPNPWNVLPLQDVTSRHRGAEPSRRCELLEKTSLFIYVIRIHLMILSLTLRQRSDYVMKLVFSVRWCTLN
jgi:hypothetical protein